MELKAFVNSIGYDGNSAIVDKAAFSANKGKNIEQLLKEGAFRAAAAYAVHTDDADGLQKVADAYNGIAGASYKKEHMYRLFGVSKAEVKKTLFL